jgi:hypothetical protein
MKACHEKGITFNKRMTNWGLEHLNEQPQHRQQNIQIHPIILSHLHSKPYEF